MENTEELINDTLINADIDDLRLELWLRRRSACQTLSEDFIKEFKDKVYWYWISKFQNLSKEFKEEFKTKLI